MQIEPATRRANFWLFVGLVLFAIGLCALVLLWMRARTHAQGGKVYPPVGSIFFCHPERSAAQSKDLPTAGRQATVSADGRKVLRLRPAASAQDDRSFKFASYYEV